MKKTFLTLFLILVGVSLFFIVVDYRGNYAAEKTVWKITQRFNQAAKDPDAVPDSTFNKIINDYEKFIKNFSNSELVSTARVLLGRVYAAKKDYEKAREVFEETISLHGDDSDLGAQVVAEIGLTYAMQEDYLSILKSYQRILKEYQFTELGLKTPVLIAKFYIEQKELAQAQKAFEDAIIYYNSLISNNPDSYIEFAALRYVATTYVTQQRWKEALDTFGKIFEGYAQSEYMTSEKLQNLINTMNVISIKYLKDPNVALLVYKKFIEDNPEYPYKEDIEVLIEKLQSFSLPENLEVEPSQPSLSE